MQVWKEERLPPGGGGGRGLALKPGGSGLLVIESNYDLYLT